MDIISYNRQSLLKNGEPWFPIMGEFHYSRFNRDYWKENLLKMKACGVDIVSTYIIWIHHEETEGVYDFSGNKDLRAFVQTAEACGLQVFLRPGPWVHAEVRNGGVPDWIKNKDFTIRTNDPGYLEAVEKYLKRVYREVEGLFHRDGGPIIGVQLENEFGHVGGLKGEEGEKHMLNLHRIMARVGFDAPFVTATGWGGALIGDAIPVMGAYADAPWEPGCEKLPPNVNFLFAEERDDKMIGSDHELGCGLTFDYTKYPYLTAELGGGNQVTGHRRPIVSAKDEGAMTLCKLGSGANLLGYYMYAGGTNPHGRYTTLQECKAAGDINDLPAYSYDFNAPIREFGTVSDTALQLKKYAMYIHDFGRALAKMDPVYRADLIEDPADFTSLRTIVRTDGRSGLLFVNNYVRQYEMAPHEAAALKAVLPDETIVFDPEDIADGEFFFYPFNMPLGENATLKYVNAEPLAKLSTDGKTSYVFFSDKAPEFHTEGDLTGIELVLLSEEEALNAWKYSDASGDRLYVSAAPVLAEEDGAYAYPRLKAGEKYGYRVYSGAESGWTAVEDAAPQVQADPEVTVTSTSETAEERIWHVHVKYAEGTSNAAKAAGGSTASEDGSPVSGVNDVLLSVDYTADTLEFIIDGQVMDDHFYTGQKWEVSMKHFGYPTDFDLKLHRLHRDTPVYLEKWPERPEETWCDVHAVDAVTELRVRIPE